MLASGRMAYEFRLGEPPGKGLKRVARQQLRQLTELLGDEADAAAGHHEARKCVKRLRALMRLVRPALGKALSAKLDRHLAKAAGALSGARDTTVILRLLERLERDGGGAAIGPQGRRLHAKLMKRPQSVREPVDLAAIEVRIKQVGKLLKAAKLSHLESADMFAGLEAEYRAGRRAVARAIKAGSAEAFHQLRKHVQRHWRHMQVFAAVWPAEMAARIALAKELSDLLGDEHDFWLLREELGRNGGRLGRLCEARQKALRSTANGLLQLLFAERSGPLRERLAAYWAGATVGAQPGRDVVADTASPAIVKPSSRQATS